MKATIAECVWVLAPQEAVGSAGALVRHTTLCLAQLQKVGWGCIVAAHMP